MSSAITLYGFSFLYGAVGSTHLGTIQAASVHFPAAQSPSILLIAAACIVGGLSFRVTAVPFHFYAPDVFQGSHAGAAAMLAFIPKAAGFLALYRIVHFDIAHVHTSAESLRVWCESIFWLMAVASMIIGNVLALLQRDLKRLLAYSSVAHAGYMLVGLAAGHEPGTVGGVAALLFYLVAYGATITGVFGMLVLLRARRPPGLHHRRPGRLEPNASGRGRRADDSALQPHGAAADRRIHRQAQLADGGLVAKDNLGGDSGDRAGDQRGDRGGVLSADRRGDVPAAGPRHGSSSIPLGNCPHMSASACASR